MSPDELLLAVIANGRISVHALYSMIVKRDTQPMATWVLPSGAEVKQVLSPAVTGVCATFFQACPWRSLSITELL